ncbi:MAG TPA: MBOAT family O-acyltransferase [Candidatus Limnocylindria bacterium]|nr:MBOAT family O-acyltransferase [Candidatus Limnocylindria bacterium]
MLFNSLTFLIFLSFTLLFYYRLPFKAQNIFLLGASYLFYGWWDYRFLFLLLFTSAFDYVCALLIEKQSDQRKRRWILILSLVSNLGVLCVFKYFNFFAAELAILLRTFGLNPSFPILQVILPVGISFYTFLSMSYTIDVYRRELKATRDPIAFLLFVSFFPHLVAGPIVRASYLLPQCEAPRTIKAEQVATGIWLVLLGYVKKVVIADRLAGVSNLGFANHTVPLFSDANSWLILYAFAFQIYGDFSGYSDIARGLSKIMGFELPVNFRAPYLVTNPTEFWRHWHITLSTWLRDYLYIPLGGNRRGPWRTALNLLITMVLGGLWHGAGIAYVLWGAYQGILLMVHRGWTHMREKLFGAAATPGRGWRWPGHVMLIVIFFHIICIGWLFFRAGALAGGEQFPLIRNYLSALANFRLADGISPLAQPILILGALGLFLQWKHAAMDTFYHWRLRWQTAAVVSAFVAIAAFGVFERGEFIYFQF